MTKTSKTIPSGVVIRFAIDDEIDALPTERMLPIAEEDFADTVEIACVAASDVDGQRLRGE